MFTRFITYIIVFVLLLGVTGESYAAKKRIRSARTSSASYSRAKLSRPTHSILVTFVNLSKVKRIDYTLNYSANGIPQGAIGSITPTGQATDSRDLYFGTCSKGVCTPHYGITNATLIVTTTLTTGGTNSKRYIIKRI